MIQCLAQWDSSGWFSKQIIAVFECKSLANNYINIKYISTAILNFTQGKVAIG